MAGRVGIGHGSSMSEGARPRLSRRLAVARRAAGGDGDQPVVAAAARTTSEVLADTGSAAIGLTQAEANRRLATFGPNAVASHRARPWRTLLGQLRSPLLGLLVAAAVVAFFVGDRNDAVIIVVIVAASVGMGFGNEYRAQRTAQALHARISRIAVAVRDGQPATVPVAALVPGDVVVLRLGDLVPADMRLMDVTGLECDESVVTGESIPAVKTTAPGDAGASLAELGSCALMGTVVHAGSGRGVVVATGRQTVLGAIAADLATALLQTEFQRGLRQFSVLLVYVAAALTAFAFAANVLMHRPLIDALLFSLAIAVGITPQLLPAVVSTSLAAGSRHLARRRVLVKRLVCIEDLGDIDVLLTDKTGTLTLGEISYARAVPAPGVAAATVEYWGLAATEMDLGAGEPVGGNALDLALWRSLRDQPASGAVRALERLAVLPFDHDRRMVSVLVREGDGTVTLVTKGAPEAVIDRCVDVPDQARAALADEFAAGSRVVAVASRPFDGARPLTTADERELRLLGLLVFRDPIKPDAAAALERLAALGVSVQVATGDSPVVAEKVCHDLGFAEGAVLTGADIAGMDDAALAGRLAGTTVLARVSPEDKARIVRVHHAAGHAVAFLGDGVNDAPALHAADVGISVDSATDVAKDAADVILLDKDLAVVADGVAEGRRIFANTVKYVLMGTSSNFGNMFSAAGASLLLPFLPMLPGQILLNNLLYDASQLTIPTDRVDREATRRPSHWDIAFIRRFMVTFGPISSLFDFATFGVLMWALHTGPAEFRSGWFIESIATQTLVIFAIRTRRIPFTRSHPSGPLTLAALAVILVGAFLPFSPLSAALGFAPLPPVFLAVLAGMVVCYLGIIEATKAVFFRWVPAHPRPRDAAARRRRHLRRRASHFSSTETTRPATPRVRDRV